MNRNPKYEPSEIKGYVYEVTQEKTESSYSPNDILSYGFFFELSDAQDCLESIINEFEERCKYPNADIRYDKNGLPESVFIGSFGEYKPKIEVHAVY